MAGRGKGDKVCICGSTNIELPTNFTALSAPKTCVDPHQSQKNRVLNKGKRQEEMANQTQVAAGAVAGLFFTLLRIEDVIFAATSLRSTEPPRSFERNPD